MQFNPHEELNTLGFELASCGGKLSGLIVDNAESYLWKGFEYNSDLRSVYIESPEVPVDGSLAVYRPFTLKSDQFQIPPAASQRLII